MQHLLLLVRPVNIPGSDTDTFSLIYAALEPRQRYCCVVKFSCGFTVVVKLDDWTHAF